ncbi:MAG: hypothetical protein AB1744_10465, partial [Candidatus Zixiibacteriota bacterium]
MMQKRTLYSLLLTSFILVCAFSVSSAQEVTVESATLLRCVTDTLDIEVTNPMDISAYEVVLEVTGDIDVDAVLHSAPANWDVFDTLDGSLLRLAGMKLGATAACLAAGGPTLVAQVVITTHDVCTGSATLDGTTFSCPSTPVTAQTQFVDCATGALVPAAVNAGTITIQNAVPTADSVTYISDSIHAGAQSFVGQAWASDADLPNGCEALTFSKLSGPAALTVAAGTGIILWTPLCADVGAHTVWVGVEDACGAVDSISVDICVWQLPPVITCPADTLIGWGDTLRVTIQATDQDNCTSPLLYSILSTTAPGSPTINAATGELEWITAFDPAYTGYFEFCVTVSDGSNLEPGCTPENADTCCFEVLVVPFLLTIQKTHNSMQGHIEQVEITMLNE